ncbi:hypothetical protein HPB49_004274 [Dermacentor silvarum]|uniref:Uncharacterized protein n=1 Tax=Dermacentor silvarum TaxID=543639 RepID=A0ACB8CV84_DERSI|nr:hypothetical protein HPB49_004274 [Dermacentor silvarum]
MAPASKRLLRHDSGRPATGRTYARGKRSTTARELRSTEIRTLPMSAVSASQKSSSINASIRKSSQSDEERSGSGESIGDLDNSATHYRVCGKHFMSGRPLYAMAETDPDDDAAAVSEELNHIVLPVDAYTTDTATRRRSLSRNGQGNADLKHGGSRGRR